PEQPWQLVQTSIKPWPSCRHTHPTIDAAGEIRALLLGEGINPADQITSVSIGTYQAALDVCTRPNPQTDYEAKFSLHHTATAALLTDDVNFNAFGPDARAAFGALRQNVHVALQEPYASDYPKSWGGAVTVELEGGRTLTATRTHAKGDPEAALSEKDLIAKAEMLFAHAAEDKSLNLPMNLTEEILALTNSGNGLPDLKLGS
ncbi:MAG: MmgE/PrpD family protein, partial [Parvibaculaceae bacterium]|nr:MmgE/PrpD family protein [Parvibaculaceae bacterium]